MKQELLCGKSVKHEGHVLSIATLLQVAAALQPCHRCCSYHRQADSLGGFNEVFLKGLSLHHLSLGRCHPYSRQLPPHRSARINFSTGRGYATGNPADLDALVSCGKPLTLN